MLHGLDRRAADAIEQDRPDRDQLFERYRHAWPSGVSELPTAQDQNVRPVPNAR